MVAETDVCGSKQALQGNQMKCSQGAVQRAPWLLANTVLSRHSVLHIRTTLQRHGKSPCEPKPLSTVQWNVRENAADRKLRGQMIHPTGPPH